MGGGVGLRFTLSDSRLMRFALHLSGWFLWFLCCPWKDFESHNSISLSSSTIPAPCLHGTHSVRKEKDIFSQSVKQFLHRVREVCGFFQEKGWDHECSGSVECPPR